MVARAASGDRWRLLGLLPTSPLAVASSGKYQKHNRGSFMSSFTAAELASLDDGSGDIYRWAASEPHPDDKARVALEVTRARNEQRIAGAKYTAWTVNRDATGDVRRLLSALGEALDEHPVSVAADGEAHCPRCAWATGKRVPLDQCHLRRAILAGFLAEAERFHAAIDAELAELWNL